MHTCPQLKQAKTGHIHSRNKTLPTSMSAQVTTHAHTQTYRHTHSLLSTSLPPSLIDPQTRPVWLSLAHSLTLSPRATNKG